MKKGPLIAEKRKASEGSYYDYFSGTFSALYGVNKEKTKDKVINISFDSYEYDGVEVECLILAFNNGFQIWDITDPDKVMELVSRREGAIKCLKFIKPPLRPERQKGNLWTKRPLFALAYGGGIKEFPENKVRLYSLKDSNYKFDFTIESINSKLSEICGYVTSHRLLVVVTTGYIIGLDNATLQKKFLYKCYPQIRSSLSNGRTVKTKLTEPRTVVALGSRWLAFASRKPLPSHTKDEEPPPNTLDNIYEVASWIGKMSRKTVTGVSSYMYSEHPPSPAPEIEQDHPAIGTVMIVDVLSNDKPVAHFRAHRKEIAFLAFDPSGKLLATASVEGCTIHIYQISPSDSIYRSFRHIYILHRGMTTAVITGITFSNDSRWLAVSTARGTTHIYAINTEGGAVNIHTHIRDAPVARFEAPFLLNKFSKPQLFNLSVLNRVKPPAPSEESLHNSMVASFRPIKDGYNNTLKLLVINHSGVLYEYNLVPHPPKQLGDNVDPRTLELSIQPTFYWDVCRRSNWQQVVPRLGKPRSNSKKEVDPTGQWLSNVEICTHTYYRPLWAGPQFTFKIFQKSEDGANAEMVGVEEEVSVQLFCSNERARKNSASGYVFPRKTEVEQLPPSADYPESQDALKDAISTPMEFSTPKKNTGFRKSYDRKQSKGKSKIFEESIDNISLDGSDFFDDEDHVSGSGPINLGALNLTFYDDAT